MIALAGCTAPDGAPGGGPSPGPSASLPAATSSGLSVELRQARTERDDRIVQLRLRNGSTVPLEVSAARLETDQLEHAATTEPDWGRRVPAGAARSAPVPLGPTRCDVGPSPGTALFRVVDEEGRSATVVLPVADPFGILDRIHDEDCSRAAVASGATLAIADTLTTTRTDGELVATIELVITPVSGGPEVVVDSVDSTVLLRPPSGARSWPVGVSTDDGPTRVPLTLVPTRCDQHAVAEDKRGTFFGVRATVDGEPQAVHHLPVSADLGRELYAFIGEHCGW